MAFSGAAENGEDVDIDPGDWGMFRDWDEHHPGWEVQAPVGDHIHTEKAYVPLDEILSEPTTANG